MRYLMFVRVDERTDMGPGEWAAVQRETDAWVQEMNDRGVRKIGERLRPVAETRIVRKRGSVLSVMDGPFIETKEQIAGFDILECASMEEAIEVASKHPAARFGAIEVRAFLEGEGAFG